MYYSLLENGMSTLVGADSNTRKQAVRTGLDYLATAILSGHQRMEARHMLSVDSLTVMEVLLGHYGWSVDEHEVRAHQDGRKADADGETFVNMPNPFSEDIRETEWVNIKGFPTRQAAIKWAQENLGADEFGRILVVAGVKPTSETEV